MSFWKQQFHLATCACCAMSLVSSGRAYFIYTAMLVICAAFAWGLPSDPGGDRS